jgi:hypothetical protein
MKRRPHHRGAHGSPACDQPGELLGLEVLQARPEPEIGVRGDLGLHPHHPLDGGRGRQRRAAQEELAREERAVEGAQAERLG